MPPTSPEIRIPRNGQGKRKVLSADKLKTIFYGDDVAAEVAREYLINNFIYAANRIPEICDSIVAVDNAMKWGYNHKLGPFEMWDAVGLEESVALMKKMNKNVPKKVEDMLKAGFTSFYQKRADGIYYFDFATMGYVRLPENPKVILLPSLKERNRLVKGNAGASLLDIGDGVACLEFHTKMNAVDQDVIQMIFDACDIVENDFAGLVVGNHAQNFSVGANIFMVLMASQKGDWDILEKLVADFQNANMRMKYLAKPVSQPPPGWHSAAAVKSPCTPQDASPAERPTSASSRSRRRDSLRRRHQRTDGSDGRRASPTAPSSRGLTSNTTTPRYSRISGWPRWRRAPRRRWNSAI